MTKILVANFGDDKPEKALKRSLAKLNIVYVDLILLHQTILDYYVVYRDLVRAYKAGKVNAIGVSKISIRPV